MPELLMSSRAGEKTPGSSHLVIQGGGPFSLPSQIILYGCFKEFISGLIYLYQCGKTYDTVSINIFLCLHHSA